MRNRSKVKFKTPAELRALSTRELDAYIASLRVRLSGMSSGPGHKSIRKLVEQALRIRALRS